MGLREQLSEPLLQLRLVIPQSLVIDGQPAFESAIRFFQSHQQNVRLNETLLKISRSLPAILEGKVNRRCIEDFLKEVPGAAQMIIVTQALGQNSLRAAA